MKYLVAALFLLTSLPAQAVENPNKPLADLTAKVMKLEESLRKLTGAQEDLEFKLRGLSKDNEELEDRVTDLQKKLDEVAKQQKASVSAAAMQAAITPAPAVKADANATAPQNIAPAAAPSAPSSATADFEKAFNLLANREVAKAKDGFTAFTQKYAGSELAGEAYFWLGEIAFGAKDYNNAAINYLKGYQAYPKGNKAADNILKTALTLQKLGKFEEACKNLGRFDAEFKNANALLKKSAAKAKTELECK